MKTSTTITTLAATTMLLAGATGCGDALVGGACAVGYMESEGECVPRPAADADSGSTGAGDAGSGGQGGTGPGSGGATHPATTTATTGTATGTGGVGAGPIGTGAGGSGGLVCDEPYTACGDVCVDLQNDPLNCGSCGHACATDICNAGVCDGMIAGHMVAIGLGYGSVTKSSPASVLLGNGVFLSGHEPLRILDYRQYAQGSSASKVGTLVDHEANVRNRTVEWTTETTFAEVPPALATGDFDVLIVHDQSAAPAGVLGVIGTAWEQPLDAFAKGGGVIVTLATLSGTNEMHHFLTAAGLLDTMSLTSVGGQALENEGFLDALGQNVLSPFLAKNPAASFSTPETAGPSTSFVIQTSTGAPVAVHKVVVPD